LEVTRRSRLGGRLNSLCVRTRERLGRAADQFLDDGRGGKEVLDDAGALTCVERKRLHIPGRAATRGSRPVAVQATAVGCARDDVPLARAPRGWGSSSPLPRPHGAVAQGAGRRVGPAAIEERRGERARLGGGVDQGAPRWVEAG